MTGADAGQLTAIVGRTRTLLLDFDGPVCRLFAGYRAPVIAEQLRILIAQRLDALPAGVVDAGPIEVLRQSADLHDPELTHALAEALRDAEVTAAASAAPTPGLREVLQAVHDTGRRVVIVSNNSAEAVRAYLDREGLTSEFALVIARYDGMDPGLLKPHDHLVHLALTALDAAASSTVLLGDSPSDINAGRALGLPTIGYANRPGKRERLAGAGADTIVDTMAELAAAIRSTPVPS
jgi:phosphoglycolate phosphatase